MQKRSLTIAGHRTSVTLEPEFWEALEAVAAARGITATLFIREVDSQREGSNLSSALRSAILRYYREREPG